MDAKTKDMRDRVGKGKGVVVGGRGKTGQNIRGGGADFCFCIFFSIDV